MKQIITAFLFSKTLAICILHPYGNTFEIQAPNWECNTELILISVLRASFSIFSFPEFLNFPPNIGKLT